MIFSCINFTYCDIGLSINNKNNGEVDMSKLDPRLFDKDRNSEALKDAFCRESGVSVMPDMLPLLEDYYKVLDTGDYDLLENLFEKGFPVNFISPYTGMPTLHALASTCSRRAINVLAAQPDVDYLLRDRAGCLASECAFRFSGDPELAQILAEKEKAQAEQKGVKLTRRPVPQPL